MFDHHGHAEKPPEYKAPTTTELLTKALHVARTFAGLTDGPLTLKANERRFHTLDGAALVEPKRGPSRRVGGYAGPSFRVHSGVYLHAGCYAGKTIPGNVTPTVIDTGTAVVTDQRVVFLGEKLTRELDWAKMLSYEHDPETRSTAFHVSNRQVVDAIRWGEASAFAFFCDLAHAHYAGTLADLIAGIERQLDETRAGVEKQ